MTGSVVATAARATGAAELAEEHLDGQVDGTLLCTEVHQVTHDVRSFVLQPWTPRAFSFMPGQYLTVTVAADGQRWSRCYSISSPPTRPDRLTITVKRVPGGPVSNWLHDHIRPGDSIEASGPFGTFTPAGHHRSAQLFLSAGSGITPLMSMARTLIDRGTPSDVVFVHHARTPADIIFRAELERLNEMHSGIRVFVVCEDDAADEIWSGHRGRISPAFLDDVAPDVAEREIFICGPTPYRRAACVYVLEAGAEPARIHEESYVFGESSPGSDGRENGGAVATHLVEFSRSQRVVECPGNTTVLEAATQAGITLPSSCQEGVCGTCKTTLLSGTVDMNHAGGIRPREIAQHKVLPCCSVPTADLVVDA
jgi:ferredoxin-NADP reductase